MSFPATLPSYTITAGSETLNGAAGGTGLSGILNAFETDITGLGTKMGTGASTPTSGKVLRGNGTGTSTWGQVVMATDVAAFTSANLASVVSDETGSGALVFGTSPTLTTPVIGDFSTAQHTHANAAGGGQLATAAYQNASITADKLSTGAAKAYVGATESTTSTSYVDLTTTTDSVTVTIGANGLALVSIFAIGSAGATGNAIAYLSFAVSGATTIAAGTQASGTVEAYNQQQGGATNVGYNHSATVLVTGLSPGSTTFKLKYKVSASTANFSQRYISVVPL